MGEEDDSTQLHLSIITLDWSKYNIDELDGNNAVIRRVDEFQPTYDYDAESACRHKLIKLAYYYSTLTKMLLFFVIVIVIEIETMCREKLLLLESNMVAF